MYALSAIKRIFKYLRVAYATGDNVEARKEMSMAALEAGIAFNNSSVTVVHGMSRPIGALFHVAHGLSNAMLLEKCLDYVLEGTYERFAELGYTVGAAERTVPVKEAAELFLKAVVQLCKDLDTPTLAEYGIKKEDFFAVIDKMAVDAMDSGSPSNTRKELAKEDLVKIYTSLWD